MKNKKILEIYSGSIAYGTNDENSDIDIRGVFLDSLENIVLNQRVEQIKLENSDTVFFELSNFLSLVKDQKPNALEFLWTDKKDIISIDDFGKYLISQRDLLLSKRAIFSYCGYAHSELSRIKGHNKWINKPQPKDPPNKKDFISVVWNLSENIEFNKKIPFDNFCAVSLKDNHFALYENKGYSKQKSWITQLNHIVETDKIKIKEKNPLMIVKFNEKLYHENKINWKNYWTWKESRNAVRGEKEELFGYDTKNAMHLIRLLRTGFEILETGKINVKRPDAQFLKDIKNGKYKYEEIISMSDDLMNKIKSLEKNTNLPEIIEQSFINKIIKDIYGKHYNLDYQDKKIINNLKV